jgi:hypothetical protein
VYLASYPDDNRANDSAIEQGQRVLVFDAPPSWVRRPGLVSQIEWRLKMAELTTLEEKLAAASSF